jgi:hypothetical protein
MAASLFVRCSEVHVGAEAVIVNGDRLRYVFLLASSIVRTDNTYKGILGYHFWVVLGAGERGTVKVVGRVDHFV